MLRQVTAGFLRKMRAKDSYDKVRDAINHHEKTITLSVGQLTTGITIPEWTAVLMLSSYKVAIAVYAGSLSQSNPWRLSGERRASCEEERLCI